MIKKLREEKKKDYLNRAMQYDEKLQTIQDTQDSLQLVNVQKDVNAFMDKSQKEMGTMDEIEKILADTQQNIDRSNVCVLIAVMWREPSLVAGT